MAYGTAAVDVIQSSTTGTPTQFQDGSGTQIGTLCRAWVNFNGTSGASPVIRASFNISSVTYNGTGDYTVNFSITFADTNYAYVAGVNNIVDGASTGYAGIQGSRKTAPATTSLRLTGFSTNTGSASDQLTVNVAIFR